MMWIKAELLSLVTFQLSFYVLAQDNRVSQQYGTHHQQYHNLTGAKFVPRPNTPSTGRPSDVSDDELRRLSEWLIENDVNNVADRVTVDIQSKTWGQDMNDKAPKRLLTVRDDVFQMETIKNFVALFNNYDPDVMHAEDVTQEERQEEIRLISSIIDTPVMNSTLQFLSSKGLFKGDRDRFKAYLLYMWFTPYQRYRRKKGSSAFEHVFLGELRRDEVLGLHDWLYFYNEERNAALNYLGATRDPVSFTASCKLATTTTTTTARPAAKCQTQKGKLLKTHFVWRGRSKPVSTMLVGTSPELGMALYTVCFLARPESKCPLSLHGTPVLIQTYAFAGNRDLIGSAYPELPLH